MAERDQGAGGGLAEVLEREFGCTPGPEMSDGHEQPYRLCESGAHLPALNFGTCEFATRVAEALAPTVARLIEQAEVRAVAQHIRSKHAADCEAFTTTLGKCNCHREAERQEAIDAAVAERLAGVQRMAMGWAFMGGPDSGATVKAFNSAGSRILAALHPGEATSDASQTPRNGPLSDSGANPRVPRPSETGSPGRSEKP